MKLLLTLLAIIALVYVALCALMFFKQRSLLYHPSAVATLPGVQPQTFHSDGATLQLWQKNLPDAPAVIYFGGNGEEVSGNLPMLVQALPSHAVTVVNYRGYGGSSGSPSEAALFADALAVFDALHASHRDIVVIGRSLGSGVAMYLASQRPVQKLVLVTPYDSIANVAKSRYGFMPINLLLRDKFDSISRVPQVHAPVLVILAEHDVVIARQRSLALIAAFPAQQLRVETLTGTGHNFERTLPTYGQLLAGFLGP